MELGQKAEGQRWGLARKITGGCENNGKGHPAKRAWWQKHQECVSINCSKGTPNSSKRRLQATISPMKVEVGHRWLAIRIPGGRNICRRKKRWCRGKGGTTGIQLYKNTKMGEPAKPVTFCAKDNWPEWDCFREFLGENELKKS